jgi:hypothetical protein
MLATSRTVEFSAVSLRERDSYVATSIWDHTLAQPGTVLLSEQDTYINPRIMEVIAKAYQIAYCDSTLTGTSFTSAEGALPRRPVRATDDGGVVIDPSAMEVNFPYPVNLAGLKIWAVKDDTDDVVFYELEG